MRELVDSRQCFDDFTLGILIFTCEVEIFQSFVDILSALNERPIMKSDRKVFFFMICCDLLLKPIKQYAIKKFMDF